MKLILKTNQRTVYAGFCTEAGCSDIKENILVFKSRFNKYGEVRNHPYELKLNKPLNENKRKSCR